MREFEVNRYGLFLAGCFSFKGNISLGSDSGAWVNVVDRCRTWHSITVAIKRGVRASQHFRSFWGAWRTIAAMKRFNDPQRPGVLECGRCEGRSAPPLYLLICLELKPNSYDYSVAAGVAACRLISSSPTRRRGMCATEVVRLPLRGQQPLRPPCETSLVPLTSD
jgi:hypothetical protein